MIAKSSIFVSAVLLSFSRRLPVHASLSTQYNGIYSIAYVTTPSEDVGKKLAHGLISGNLAACVNIVPRVTSLYLWEGKVNEDNETMMIIKTRTSRINDLTHYIINNHPYSVCEVISTKIENGNEAYLKWLGETVP